MNQTSLSVQDDHVNFNESQGDVHQKANPLQAILGAQKGENVAKNALTISHRIVQTPALHLYDTDTVINLDSFTTTVIFQSWGGGDNSSLISIKATRLTKWTSSISCTCEDSMDFHCTQIISFLQCSGNSEVGGFLLLMLEWIHIFP